MRYARFCTFSAFLCTILLPSAAFAAKVATDPTQIASMATRAYVWGLGPEYIERFSKYNTLIGAPLNALKYGSVPSAWNNIYYPAPGDPPPSILPCTQACAPALAKSYIPPAVEMVPQPL